MSVRFVGARLCGQPAAYIDCAASRLSLADTASFQMASHVMTLRKADPDLHPETSQPWLPVLGSDRVKQIQQARRGAPKKEARWTEQAHPERQQRRHTNLNHRLAPYYKAACSIYQAEVAVAATWNLQMFRCGKRPFPCIMVLHRGRTVLWRSTCWHMRIDDVPQLSQALGVKAFSVSFACVCRS